jgi:hypothetical protein
MPRITLSLRILLILFFTYLSFETLTDYFDDFTRASAIFWLLHLFSLYIHEAGHFIWSIFGREVGILGGGLNQIAICVFALIVLLRSGLHTLLYTLFWLGFNFVDVAIYMADAPYRRLPLIAKGLIHDWYYLSLHWGIMEDITFYAMVVYYIGALCLMGAIGAGIYSLVHDYRHPAAIIHQPDSLYQTYKKDFKNNYDM